MSPKQHPVVGKMSHASRKIIHPAINFPYYDNWIWSRRHRSHEIILAENFRKGMAQLKNIKEKK